MEQKSFTCWVWTVPVIISQTFVSPTARKQKRLKLQTDGDDIKTEMYIKNLKEVQKCVLLLYKSFEQ